MEALVLIAFAGAGLVFFFWSLVRVCSENEREWKGAEMSFSSAERTSATPVERETVRAGLAVVGGRDYEARQHTRDETESTGVA